MAPDIWLMYELKSNVNGKMLVIAVKVAVEEILD